MECETKEIDILKKIREVLRHQEGTMTWASENELVYKVEIHEFSNACLLSRISSLIEVCILALDGKGDFYSPDVANSSREGSVCMVLELAIAMLPFEQMSCLDDLYKILENDKTSDMPKEDH